MEREIFTCIDAGTDYCPCHLADTGDCIICSMLSDKKECDCCNWSNSCIYNDYILNNEKPKKTRQYYKGKIIKKHYITNDVIILSIRAPYNLIKDLSLPGSFIFLKLLEDENCFDIPLSVMDTNLDENLLKLAIEIKGPKTNRINEIGKDEYVLLRGPYWNGIMGVNHINKAMNSNVLTISKGIHQAPLIPVLKTLNNSNNHITSFIDTGRIEKIFIEEYLKSAEINYLRTTISNHYVLNNEFAKILIDYILKVRPSLVFCAATDRINYNILKLIKSISLDIKFACTNNSRMCCGEGVCGCCTIKNKDHILRRLCKMQTDPEFILEGRF